MRIRSNSPLRGLVLLLSLTLVTAPFSRAFAEGAHHGAGISGGCETCASEYVSGNLPKSLLMRIELIGAVQKPGTYFVPKGTDLVKLIASAGGITGGSDEDIVLRRQDGDKYALLEVNLNDVVRDEKESPPQLVMDDVVYIPFTRPTISDNTLRWVTVVTGILALSLTAYLVLRPAQ